MSKRFFLSILIALLGAAPQTPLLASYQQIQAYEEKKVAQIDISVENLPPEASFDPKTVLNRLKTKVGDPFSQLTFDSDLKMLSEEYDRVEPSIESQNGEVYVTLKLWPRPMIRTIRWSGNSRVSTRTLRKELGVKPNHVFNRPAFNKSFNKVKEYYIKKGYFEAELRYKVILDAKTNQVDIEVDISEGRSGKIDNIKFNGFTKQEQSDLLIMIHTKKYNFLMSWFLGTGIYNEEALEQDKLTILNYMQNHGFADARVDIKVLESDSDGKIMLEIDVDRGPVYHFGKITFKGNKLFTDQQIDNSFLVRPGDTYSPEKLRDTAQGIKDLYGRKGYIETDVQYEARLDPNDPIFNVSFQIEEGEQFKIGMIRVFGNVQTQSNVILRESLLIPGETFDTAKLKATQARLENIGYFKKVNVYAVRTQDDITMGENYRDVYIEVEETTTGNISLFFGFSSADNLFGGLDLAETNFNYKGIPRIFKDGLSALRGGGEYAHARASFGTRQTTYSVSWLTPYFRDTLWRVGFDVNKSSNRLFSKDYDIITYGGAFYASYPITNLWLFSMKYRIRHTNNEVSGDATPQERAQAANRGLISAVSASLAFDATDSALRPHRGLRSFFDLEYAGLGGRFDFMRMGYINAYYLPLWNRATMRYRAEFRYILPLFKTNQPTDIPLSERFFLGGENSVRGYKAFDLGPHFTNGDPTGGISSNFLSIDLIQSILPILDVFAFADMGSIALNKFALKNFKYSWGFGTRIELLNKVPVILGIGFPINPKEDEGEVRKFYFSMGGQF